MEGMGISNFYGRILTYSCSNPQQVRVSDEKISYQMDAGRPIAIP